MRLYNTTQALFQVDTYDTRFPPIFRGKGLMCYHSEPKMGKLSLKLLFNNKFA